MYCLQNHCCCQPQIDRTFEIRCLFADFSKYHLFCGHCNRGSVSDVCDVPHRPHKYTRSHHRSHRNVLPAQELPPRPQTAHMPFVFPDKRQFECILSLPDERSHLTWQAFPDLQTRSHPVFSGRSSDLPPGSALQTKNRSAYSRKYPAPSPDGRPDQPG